MGSAGILRKVIKMVEQNLPRKTGNIWRWALGGSVALNLVFIGLLGGAALRSTGDIGRDGFDRGDPVMRGYATPYVRALPEDARRTLRTALRNGPDANLMSRAERRAQYRQMVDVIRAEPFEAQAARQVLDAQSQAVLGVQAAAQDLWLTQISQMSDRERAAYADRLEEVLARRGPPGKKRGGKPLRD
jgi:uncharacterized membrane protein